jgi:P27 family predicted phage terminase small subunit
VTAGRRRKPMERAKLTGRTATTDSGGRKLPAITGTIVPTTNLPAVPDGLQERGQVEWGKVWAAGESWLAPDQDYHWVEMIARAYDEIEAFREKILEDGLIQTGSMGQVIAHPLIAEVRRAEASIQKCLSVLGFSPTDRARLGLAVMKARSKLEEMMANNR